MVLLWFSIGTDHRTWRYDWQSFSGSTLPENVQVVFLLFIDLLVAFDVCALLGRLIHCTDSVIGMP